MLTADLVRARRRNGRLELVELSGAARKRAHELASRYIEITEQSVGTTREELEQAWRVVAVSPRDRRVAAGLRKLVEDRCHFDVVSDVDPETLRRDTFERAALARRALGPGDTFDREAVLRDTAAAVGLADAARVDDLLYADLRAAHRLVQFEPVSAEWLLDLYDLQQAQAVLLRAVRLTAWVRCASPGTYRRLFRKLKFLRLLHRIEEASDGGYRIEVDGPYSLFAQTTKYGLQLALMLPALRECDAWSLRADVRWGNHGPLSFEQSGHAVPPADQEPDDSLLPDEVATLLERFHRRSSPWTAAPCTEVLSLPGLGVCVPDLVFTRASDGARAYLEVLGFWSREAVFKRVELLRGGLPHPVVFAVPRRLRVSEDIVDGELPGALYVYKGAMSAAAVEERLERVVPEAA